jgi:hypothetical protein
MSNFELYVKECEQQGVEPGDIKQFLSSMLAYGGSMLLYVAPDSTAGKHYRDFQFPKNTHICAANPIIGSFFIGEGHKAPDNPDSTNDYNADTLGSYWADKVVDYGDLIDNDNITAGAHTAPNINIPVKASN